MSKTPLRALQSARITQAMESDDVAYGSENVILPAGSTGTVLEIFGDAEDPRSYLVEVPVTDPDNFALVFVPAEFIESVYTPEEEAVLAQYTQRANDSREKVQSLDRNWWPPNYWTPFGANRSPTFAERLKNLDDDIAAAQARLKELRATSPTPPAPTNTSES